MSMPLFSLKQVDMFDSSTMRYFSAPSTLAVVERETGIRRDLISLVPWWREARMLVVVPGGGANPSVLRRVVSIDLCHGS